MTYRLTGYLCNDKWIVGVAEKLGPTEGTAGSHLSVAPKKLVSPQSTQTQTLLRLHPGREAERKINMRGSHYLGPNLRGKGIPRGCLQHNT